MNPVTAAGPAESTKLDLPSTRSVVPVFAVCSSRSACAAALPTPASVAGTVSFVALTAPVLPVAATVYETVPDGPHARSGAAWLVNRHPLGPHASGCPAGNGAPCGPVAPRGPLLPGGPFGPRPTSTAAVIAPSGAGNDKRSVTSARL